MNKIINLTLATILLSLSACQDEFTEPPLEPIEDTYFSLVDIREDQVLSTWLSEWNALPVNGRATSTNMDSIALKKQDSLGNVFYSIYVDDNVTDVLTNIVVFESPEGIESRMVAYLADSAWLATQAFPLDYSSYTGTIRVSDETGTLLGEIVMKDGVRIFEDNPNGRTSCLVCVTELVEVCKYLASNPSDRDCYFEWHENCYSGTNECPDAPGGGNEFFPTVEENCYACGGGGYGGGGSGPAIYQPSKKIGGAADYVKDANGNCTSLELYNFLNSDTWDQKQPYDDWNRLTECEKNFFETYPAFLYQAKKDRSMAEIAAKRRFPNCTLYNDIGDAFRHAYFSALNARRMGYTNAKRLGNCHEDWAGNPANEKDMDLNNNQWGYNYTSTHGIVQVDQFYTAFIEAFNNGKIKILKQC